MTEPKMVKAMEYLDDDLIVAAAEEKKAAPRFTKKKVLVLLAACFMLVLSFVMMGTEEAPVELSPEERYQLRHESLLVWFDDMIEMYQDDPEILAYYTKWRGTEFPDPYPAEWQNEDGSMKEFVTVQMLNEAFRESLMYEFIMDDPMMKNGMNASVVITLDEDRKVQMVSSVVTYQERRDEYGNFIDVKGEM